MQRKSQGRGLAVPARSAFRSFLHRGSAVPARRPHPRVNDAKAFFRSAKSATGLTPDRVTTDGHGSYPRAIRSTLGRHVERRTSAYRNNGLEQDHRDVKGRVRRVRGFKAPGAAARFCRGYDEFRAFLRCRNRHNQHVPADHRGLLHLRRAITVLATLQAA
ncbi:MAG: DDE-type integrase/transposase/recombinase [Acetobacteraceae bacterium]|nr:DDE-type integrase/transposase/recombinase [Acetobacteraceae bacterium]